MSQRKISPRGSPRRDTKSNEAANARTKQQELPLLDEINDLIEKERTVLNLKLLAQKAETEEWKAKYGSLADKLEGGIGGEVKTVEDVADIDENGVEASSEGQNVSHQELLRVVSERNHSWIIDLSNLSFDRTLFAKACKAIFGPKSSFPEIHVAILRGCSLNDDFSEAVGQLARSLPLWALDLSNNELGETTLAQIISVLKERRTTPQYLLMDRNSPIASSTKIFPSIIESLTEHTWGLTVSLQDFTDVIISLNMKISSRRANRRPEPNQDYKEVVKHPMRIFEFLRAVNTKLDPVHFEDPKKTKNKGIRAPRACSMVPGRENALNHLSVLGLTCAQFSKRSVTELASTLKLTAPSLTDLDLSFSYLGFHGAEVLKTALLSADCQIIRLGVAGNAFGDRGTLSLCSSLPSNVTMTYLDLRSNNISDVGLHLIESHLLSAPSLHLIDLRGNSSCSTGTVFKLKRLLWSHGSNINVKTSYLDIESLPSFKLTRNISTVLHEIPQQTSVSGILGKPVRLYSIDLTAINVNYPDVFGEPLLLEWMWRPIPLGTPSAGSVLRERMIKKEFGTTIGANRNHVSNLPQGAGSNEASYLARGSKFSLKWEVRLTYNHQELRTVTEEVTATTCTTRRLLASTSDWAMCSCMLSELPLKGNIEIWVNFPEASNKDEEVQTVLKQKKGSHVVHSSFQGMRMKLSRFSSFSESKAIHITGDSLQFGSAYKFSSTNPLLCGAQMRETLLNNYEVLRTIRCPMRAAASDNYYLSWQAKLAAFPDRNDGESLQIATIANTAKTGADTSRTYTELVPPNHATLGYHWSLFLFRHSGHFCVLHEDYCIGRAPITEDTLSTGTATKQEKPLTDGDGVLKAWALKDFEFKLESVNQGDLIILAARVISTQENYPQQYLKQCSAIVTQFHLWRKCNDVSETSSAFEARSEISYLNLEEAMRNSMCESYEVLYDDPSCSVNFL